MTPRWKWKGSLREEILPREPGTIKGREEIDRDEGGVLRATCGVCGNVVEVEVRPSKARHRAETISYWALRRAGWRWTPIWGWVEKSPCLREIEKSSRAGHVQTSLF